MAQATQDRIKKFTDAPDAFNSHIYSDNLTEIEDFLQIKKNQ